jgi:hypothetical protein
MSMKALPPRASEENLNLQEDKSTRDGADRDDARLITHLQLRELKNRTADPAWKTKWRSPRNAD